MTEGERRPDEGMLDRSEGFGERLLGVLLTGHTRCRRS